MYCCALPSLALQSTPDVVVLSINIVAPAVDETNNSDAAKIPTYTVVLIRHYPLYELG
jgi:hypothetical protein